MNNRLWHIFVIAVALAALTLDTQYALCKPGGHALRDHECLATFRFEEPYNTLLGGKPLRFYLSGTGFASFNGVPVYGAYDINDALNSSSLAMRWEVNNCFAGNYPQFGVVEARAKVKSRDGERSSIIFSADTPNGLFPATVVNELFFEIYVPTVGIRMFNKEPIVLTGKANNLSADELRTDVRVQSNQNALPKALKAILDGSRKEPWFEPAGQHTLAKPVKFYRVDRPDEVVCTLVDSELVVQSVYGIEIECTETSIDGAFLTATISVKNLTNKSEECVWYVADSHELTIVGVQLRDEDSNWHLARGLSGNIKLGSEPFELRVQAYNNNVPNPTGKNACVFCGVQNTPKDLNAFKTEKISGFVVIQGDEFRNLKK